MNLGGVDFYYKMIKKKNRKWLVIVVILIFILLNRTQKKEAESATVNFGSVVGTHSMEYGANEDDAWYRFATNSVNQQKHQDVGTKYIRAWLSAQHYRPSTYPLQSGGGYDWTNVDLLINAVLNSNAIPIVVFAHGDRCGDREQYTSPFDFSNCEGHGSVPPSSTTDFADYVVDVIQHLDQSHNINGWYFEIWNEPSGSMWWDGYYITLYNTVVNAIDQAYPSRNFKIGGPSTMYSSSWGTGDVVDFVNNCNPDYVTVHHYANVGIGDFPSHQQRMDNIRTILYDDMVSLRSVVGQGTEIHNGEYNIDWVQMDLLDDDFVGSWEVAALINMIKAGVDMEQFYSGTGEGGPAYAMWLNSGVNYPVYDAKKRFVESHPTGSTMYFDSGPTNFDILASEYGGQKYITVVNKQDSTQTLDLTLQGGVSGIQDLETSQTYGTSPSISFNNFEVKYFQVTNGQTYNYQYFETQKDNYLIGNLILDNFIVSANNWVG